MFIDIHSHILPGIDDGSRDMEQSLEIIKIAVLDGITAIFATPHVISGVYENRKEDIRRALQEVNKQIRAENITLQLLPGAEIRLEPDLPQRQQRGELMSLNDTGRYLLLELPSAYIPDYTDRVIYELQLQGITTILAHPERNVSISKNPRLLLELAARGTLVQLNTGSITGLFGSEVKKTAHKLLKLGCVHALGSDAHSAQGGRIPVISPAYEQIKKLYGAETAEILSYVNPSRIISGENIITIKAQKRFTFWR